MSCYSKRQKWLHLQWRNIHAIKPHCHPDRSGGESRSGVEGSKSWTFCCLAECVILRSFHSAAALASASVRMTLLLCFLFKEQFIISFTIKTKAGLPFADFHDKTPISYLLSPHSFYPHSSDSAGTICFLRLTTPLRNRRLPSMLFTLNAWRRISLSPTKTSSVPSRSTSVIMSSTMS